MAVRMAVVAGQFYEASQARCEAQIKEMLPAQGVEIPFDGPILAGVVPHAGWVFSGNLAALVFAAVRQRQQIDTFVIFGAVHSAAGRAGMLYESGQWGTPLGAIDVDAELAAEILAQTPGMVEADQAGHSGEHSIEVQVPIIQHLFPDAKIVPLMVPPGARVIEIGRATARAIQQSDKNVLCLASTDLTHYGPSYYHTPMGTGSEALKWAKDENDKFFIDLALTMQADQLVTTAQSYGSACGAGAVAAAVAAASELGAEKGHLLAHTTSAEIVAEKFHQPSQDSVGYAAIVYG